VLEPHSSRTGLLQPRAPGKKHLRCLSTGFKISAAMLIGQ